MKSKTSFFNMGLFKSSLKRFWPLWTAHFAVWFIILPVVVLINNISGTYYRNFTLELLDGVIGFPSVIFAFVMAILSAMAMYSFMYASRSTGLIASLPVKREAVFGSAFTAGLLPVVGSNLVIALLTLLCSLGCGNELGLVFKAIAIWFAVYSMEYVVFYGIASLTAMMTGNLLVLPVLYVIFNFLFIGMEQIVRMILSAFVWGMENYSLSAVLEFLCPLIFLGSNLDMALEFEPGSQLDDPFSGSYDYSACTAVSFGSWSVLLIYFAVGIAFSAIALLMFRKHRMESAGDVIAVPCLRPVFKYGVTACTALCGGLLLFVIFASVFDSRSAAPFIMIPCMIICAFIGYFGSEMLLKKSFHVFRGGWTGFIVLSCLCAVFTFCCDTDVLGVGRIVPDPDKVESIEVYDAGLISNRDVIKQFTELQKEIIDDRDRYVGNDDAYDCVMFRYTMKDGSVFSRQYDIADDENYKAYYDIISSPDVQLERFTPSVPVDIEHCTGGYFYSTFYSYDEYGNETSHDYRFSLSPEQAVDFYQNALIPDIKSGNKVIGRGEYPYYASLEIYLTDKNVSSDYESASFNDSLCVDINSECTNCLRWIKDNLGVDLVALAAEYDTQVQYYD